MAKAVNQTSVDAADRGGKLKRKAYDKKLRKLQAELCRLQEWVKHKWLRVIVVFEGRDAAGKGGTIRAIRERVSPGCFGSSRCPLPRIVRSRRGTYSGTLRTSRCRGSCHIRPKLVQPRQVEYVMGFCSKEEHRRILELCPLIEKFVVDGGIQLMKIWLEVSDKEQKRRFEARIDDPLRQWKLSPMDLPSRERWYEYSRARDKMLEVTTRSTRRGIRARSDQPWQFHQTGHGGSKVPDLAGALLQSR